MEIIDIKEFIERVMESLNQEYSWLKEEVKKMEELNNRIRKESIDGC